MSLQFILGNSGAGKSHYLYETVIRQSLEHPEKTYLVIVPEQFTMQTQKELVSMHPAHGILNIDVLSFQRLAFRVFEEVGGDHRAVLEETGKSLVIQKMAQEHKKELPYLGGQMKKPGYVQEVKSLISELMQYDVGPKQLEEAAADSRANRLLAVKLADVQVLYEAFEHYLKDKYMTAEEVLDVLCGAVPKSARLKNSVLAFDGFTGFTPVQYKLLGQLLSLSPKLYVTVTLDSSEDAHTGGKSHQLFSLSKKTVRTLCRLAGGAKTEILQDIRIEPGEKCRFCQAPALGFLEKNLFRYGGEVYGEEQSSIRLTAAEQPLAEMEETALEIGRLVREEGLYYRDIAVMTGDLGTYGSYARQAFDKVSIPYFLDEKHSILMNPFVEFIRAAVDMAAQNYSYESVFRYLRCGMSGLSQEEIDRLENYVIALGIRGWKKWQERFVRLYKGLEAGDVEALENSRKKFVRETEEFTAACRKRPVTVEEMCKGLYQFIVRGDIQKKLKVRELEFAAMGEKALEKEYAQIYGIVMGLLDKLVDVLGEETVTLKEFQSLLEAGLSEAKVAIIPPSADQVLVGDVERTRLKNIKVLFFVGMNEGIIPKSPKSGGILSEADREYFAEQGIELAPDSREAMFIQRFYLYLNLTKPSYRLYLSFAKANAKGEPLGPAYLIGVVQNLFPLLHMADRAASAGGIQRLENPQNSLEELVAGLRRLAMGQGEPDALWKELMSWYQSSPQYGGTVRRLVEGAFAVNPRDKISASVAKALYGEISPHSATRLERYAACAFAHFLRYGLLVTERAQYEFSAMDMGNVMHSALEQFSAKLKELHLSWEELREEKREQLAEECIQEVVHDYGNTILHSSARNEYMIRRSARILKRTVWALQKQLTRGQFVPEGFEVSFGGGRIDRLDVCRTGDKVYIKIIDYKTGNTSFDLVALYHGLQLQLAVYLDAALKIEEKNYPDKQVEPAGIFYYNIKDPILRTNMKEEMDQVDERIYKELQMNGLVLAEDEAIDRLDSSLESIPVSRNKDGSLGKRSSVATGEQFSLLNTYVHRKIENICTEILEGNAQAAPYELDKENACTYCPYQSVCGFDEKIPGYQFRRLKKMGDQELWEAMEREV